MLEVLTDATVTEKSSAPVVAEEEAQITNSASAEETKPEAESKPQEPDHALETKKALKGVQKRIDELTRARYEAEERGRQEAETARQEAAYWRQQAEAAKQAAHKPPESGQFQDYEQYLREIAKYEATNVTDARMQQERQAAWEYQQAQARQAQEAQQRASYEQAVNTKIAEAVKKFPDFIEVVTSPELPGLQGTPAFGAIMESDIGAEVTYYLGKNPARAHQIAAMSPLSQVREIGRIEAAIQSGKSVSNAPPPPASLDGKSGTATKDPSRMSYEEFVDYRRRQIAQRR